MTKVKKRPVKQIVLSLCREKNYQYTQRMFNMLSSSYWCNAALSCYKNGVITEEQFVAFLTKAFELSERQRKEWAKRDRNI